MKCLVCNFECNDLRQHAKTDWHIYNLRRDTIGLKSISLDDFQAKQNDLILKNIVQPKEEHFCCNKLFKSNNTYENHLKSKKHIKDSLNNEIKKGDKEEIGNHIDEEGMIIEYVDESSDNEAEDKVLDPLTLHDCLFCTFSAKSVEKSLKHMKLKHNFNLPYFEYVSDLNGLLQYLICLIDEYNVCLQCNKQFDNRNCVRNHMLDKNHFQLYFHLESNGDDLCDFYSDLPKPVATLHDSVNEMEIEVCLPNGKRIGNRNMNIYFKQNLNGLSNINKLAITSGVDKAKMSLIKSGVYGHLANRVLTPQEKKYKTLESRYVQLRNSRYSNFQQHFRAQILM